MVKQKWTDGATTAANLLTAASTSWTVYCNVRDWLKERQKPYTVTVSGTDLLYDPTRRWIVEQLSTDKLRGLSVISKFKGRGRHSTEVLYSGEEQPLRIDGHDVTVVIEMPSLGDDDGAEALTFLDQRYHTLKFTSSTLEGRRAVTSALDAISNTLGQRNPRLFVAAPGGGWNSWHESPQRNLRGLSLHNGQKERLINDLGDFLNRKGDYQKRGIPYHRGYLLYGPPGTGKTSAAQALASHYNLDTYYMPLADIGSDGKLSQLFSSIEPYSMLLLEDIDRMLDHPTTEATRGTDDNGFTISGLLNSLDGISTPPGLIVFMTTNHVHKLDEAIIRSGRIDVKEHLGYLESTQLYEMYCNFYGIDEWEDPPTVERTDIPPSDVMEVLKQNFDTPDLASKQIAQLVRE